jgi:hypothetical protein
VSHALIGIDPGRRIGVAWVGEDGSLQRSAIVSLDALRDLPLRAAAVVVGDGTGSDEIAALLVARAVAFHWIDETGTSEEGRRLYWRSHPPRGLLRFVPEGFRVPPRDVDDFAAYAIALRFLARNRVASDESAPGQRRDRGPNEEADLIS